MESFIMYTAFNLPNKLNSIHFNKTHVLFKRRALTNLCLLWVVGAAVA